MVAYSFKRQFVEPIRAGTKRQTIRAIGKRRHAQPGDELQLYCGMRSEHCFLIGRTTCVEVQDIEMELSGPGRPHSRIKIGRQPFAFNGRDLDAFARNDGFADWRTMREFWRVNHRGVLDFKGKLVRWTAIQAA